jgi:threonine/homoserine/homoserine lactone efflux protein
MCFFLFSVVAISLTGVMMPGPMFAVTVAKSYKSASAGPLVALGHGFVEIPLMLLIYLGMAAFLENDLVKFSLGFAGGGVLIYLGVNMFKARLKAMEGRGLPYNPIIVGIFTSIFNPFFLVWWATVGAMLIAKSLTFGSIGFGLLIPAHWLCDLGWLSFVSLVVYKTKHLWGSRVQRAIFAICSLILICFGLWFIISALGSALSNLY